MLRPQHPRESQKSPSFPRRAILILLCVSLCGLSACQDGGESLRRSLRQAAKDVGGRDSQRPDTETARSSDPAATAGQPEGAKPVIGNPAQKEAAAKFQISCSPGGRLNGTPPPKGWSLWCEKKGADGKIVKHDSAVAWHRNQEVSLRAVYHEGKRHGPYQTFYRNGSPQETRNYFQGLLQGPVVKYNERGEKLNEVTFLKGTKHGPYKKWSRSGVPLEEGSHLRDLKHGVLKRFYRSGQVRSSTEYKGGKKNGKFRETTEEGQLKAVGSFRDDKPDGSWQAYGRNGMLVSSGTYREGKKDGHWTEYDRNGQVKQRQLYADGRTQSSSRGAAPREVPVSEKKGWQPL